MLSKTKIGKVAVSSYLLLACLLFFFSTNSYSQNKTENDLLFEMSRTESDTGKFSLLIKLAGNALGYDDKKANTYSEKALELARKISDPKKLADANLWRGRYFESISEYKKALEFYFSCIDLLDKHFEGRGSGSAYNSIGICYWYQEFYAEAEDYFLKAIKFNTRDGSFGDIAMNYANLAMLNDEMGKKDTALKMYEQALLTFVKLNNQEAIAACYDNMGLIYNDLNAYQKSLEHHQIALAIRKKENDLVGVSASLNNIGYAHLKAKQYHLAIEPLSQSLEISRELHSKYDEKLALINLANSYAGLGNYEKAFESYKAYSSVKDSLLNDEKNKQISEMQAKYQKEQHEKTIERLEKEQALKDLTKAEEDYKNKMVTYVLIGLALLLLVTVVFVFIRYREKQKANNELGKKNSEILYQKEIIEEKNKDITDSIYYAQTIQKSILPEEQRFISYFKDAFILFLPRDIVSGDFYWSSSLKVDQNDYLIFAIADCTGHGVPGAFMSMLGNNLLDRVVNGQHVISPNSILEQVNENLKKILKQGGDKEHSADGMDITVCVWHQQANRLIYSSAQRPLYLFRKNELQQLEYDHHSIGGKSTTESFSNFEINLQSGDRIYLFTDGFVDQFGGPQTKKYQSKRFREKLLAIQHLNMTLQQLEIKDAFYDWKGNNTQIDDVTVVGIEF